MELEYYLIQINQTQSRRESKRLATEALELFGSKKQVANLIQEATKKRKSERPSPINDRNPWGQPGGGCPGGNDGQGWEP